MHLLLNGFMQEADKNKRNSYGETPLIVAAGLGHLAVVKLLLEAQADIH